MSHIYTSADQLIGKTPLLELTHIEKKFDLKAKILAKLEYFNPAGSVKDRVARAMIDDAEAKGLLKEGSVIIEPTSGNTGIGLASVAAARGYRIIIVMPETMSVERRQLMKAYGAELVLSDGAKGMKGAIAKADELAKETPNSFIPGQFVNPANPKAHFETDRPRNLGRHRRQGRLFRRGRRHRRHDHRRGRIFEVEGCFGQGRGRRAEDLRRPVHRRGRPAQDPGHRRGLRPPTCWTPRSMTRSSRSRTKMRLTPASSSAGPRASLVGISSGAALWAAIEVAKRPENEGKNIVVLLPDTGDRYLSTPLFAD